MSVHSRDAPLARRLAEHRSGHLEIALRVWPKQVRHHGGSEAAPDLVPTEPRGTQFRVFVEVGHRSRVVAIRAHRFYVHGPVQRYRLPVFRAHVAAQLLDRNCEPNFPHDIRVHEHRRRAQVSGHRRPKSGNCLLTFVFSKIFFFWFLCFCLSRDYIEICKFLEIQKDHKPPYLLPKTIYCNSNTTPHRLLQFLKN